jgi:hypothetical protein
MFSFYDLIALWNNFFFDPINMINLGLFRICIGLVCCYKIYALNYRLNEYLGVDGWYMLKLWKRASDSKHYFCIFNYLPSTNNSVLFVMSIFLISSICLTLGLCTALSSAIAYICWLSICHRNIFIFNSGDSLLRMLLFFLVFSYGGYYCSLDNYIYNRDQIQACLNPWVTRLMQISVLSMYLHTVYYKINYGADWCDGTAVHYACNNFSFNRLNH